jgi:hypothetical protein
VPPTANSWPSSTSPSRPPEKSACTTLLRTIFFSSQPRELQKRRGTTAAQAVTLREPAASGSGHGGARQPVSAQRPHSSRRRKPIHRAPGCDTTLTGHRCDRAEPEGVRGHPPDTGFRSSANICDMSGNARIGPKPGCVGVRVGVRPPCIRNCAPATPTSTPLHEQLNGSTRAVGARRGETACQCMDSGHF